MNTKYDNKLNELEWFKIHPQLLPFVGDNYDDYKILQIGESHYIDREKDDDKFDICYFRDHWWKETCDDLVKSFDDTSKYNGCWFDTRRVLHNYLDGKVGSYGIFSNVVKSFSKIMLDKDISNVSLEEKKLYNNFAFMNFYQMPSLYLGQKYWNSLVKSAKYVCKDDKKLAHTLPREIFRKCVEISIKAVDDVIDIIEPKIIIFTSISARNAYSGKEYEECKGKYYKDDNRVIYTSHPSAPFSWNKPLKALKSKAGEKKTGQQVLEEKLLLFKKHL